LEISSPLSLLYSNLCGSNEKTFHSFKLDSIFHKIFYFTKILEVLQCIFNSEEMTHLKSHNSCRHIVPVCSSLHLTWQSVYRPRWLFSLSRIVMELFSKLFIIITLSLWNAVFLSGKSFNTKCSTCNKERGHWHLE
jgi:hypothetical protein